MKLTIESQQLREAFRKIGSIVDNKISRPILTNCLFKAENNKIELIATDLEVSAKIIVPAKIEKSGSLCINSKNIFDILKELPNDTVTLEVGQNNLLKIKCQNIDYSLMVTSADEYPRLNFQSTSTPFVLDSSEVIEMVNKTIHAVSTDETRIFLTGIYLQVLDQKLKAVAIDGHRLALFTMRLMETYPAPLKDGVIIPRKGVNEFKKMADSMPDGKIKISVDDSFLFLELNSDYVVTIRLISREYPKYQSVIPAKTQYHFGIEREAILNAVKRIRILSNEKTNGIKMLISDKNLTLSTNHPALGQATEVIDINYSGKALDIGFNAKYLMDTLQVLPEGEVVFEFNNELSPVVMKSPKEKEFLGIIMPLKL
jgi:DNA polymerase III subunit beta